MNKEDKYSLGYAIGNSIQENKDKITKLEKKVKNLTNKNKKLQHQLKEKEKVIDEAINYINETTTFIVNGIPKNLKDEISGTELLKILERGKNVKYKN